jgi:hypothetical protein
MQDAAAQSESGESSESGATEPTSDSRMRAPSRPRARKALPTDRLKLDVQKGALVAISLASDYGRRAVGSEDIAPRIGVSPATAGLNNAFFMESGLITRESKGRYKPTNETIKFARDYAFDAVRAGKILGGPLAQTWCFHAVRQQLGMGPVSKDTMIQVLAHEAGASKDHQVQLAAMLSWLEYAGLIEDKGGNIKIIEGAAGPPAGDAGAAGTAAQDVVPPADVPDRAPVPPTPAGATTKTGHQAPRGNAETMLGFAFDFSLTKDDLGALSGEQIEALFGAVGKLMAIKASIDTG